MNPYQKRIAASRRIFATRLRELGFRTYPDYLQSETWRNFRSSYYSSSARPRCCFICGKVGPHLHHLRYDNLGRESWRDVVPVCERHHQDIHQLQNRLTLEEATEHIRALYERRQRKQAAKDRAKQAMGLVQRFGRKPLPSAEPKPEMVAKYGGYLAKQSAKEKAARGPH